VIELKHVSTLDATMVGRIVEAQFPQCIPARVTYLGEGYDSTAFDVNGAWVFRFPKRADVEQQLLVEMRILPVLASRAPLPIPAFSLRGEPSPEFPRQFGGYRKLAGVPGIETDPARVPFSALAPMLGRFLSWLHAFPAGEAARHGVQRQPIAPLVEEIRAEALEDFERLNAVAPDAPLETWHTYLKCGVAEARSPLTPALVHNDLAAEHILVGEGAQTVTGIIDWSDLAVGDPALDIAAMFHWGGQAFAEAVLAAYDGSIDDGLVSRARFMAACRGVGDVKFGLETDRREYIAGGLRALRLCAGA
jgi:aminoglycoside phosphotransferase (APT) family kinase protein